MKEVSMLMAVLAETSINCKPCSSANLSPSWYVTSRLVSWNILVVHVAFISHQQNAGVLIAIALGLFQPLFQVQEGVSSGDIVDQNDSCSGSVIGPGDRTEAFLTSGVPDL